MAERHTVKIEDVVAAEDDATDAVQRELEALRTRSHRLDPAQSRRAKLLADLQAERDRLDAEGATMLREFTVLREAEARSATGGRDVRGICDWSTHKQTAKAHADGSIDFPTGRGWVVVQAPAADAVAAALAPGASVGGAGLSLYDNTSAGVERVLLKAVVLAPDVPARGTPGEEARREQFIKRLACEAPGLAQAAVRAALGLAGLWATDTAKK